MNFGPESELADCRFQRWVAGSGHDDRCSYPGLFTCRIVGVDNRVPTHEGISKVNGTSTLRFRTRCRRRYGQCRTARSLPTGWEWVIPSPNASLRAGDGSRCTT
jgi:hypothetical protein